MVMKIRNTGTYFSGGGADYNQATFSIVTLSVMELIVIGKSV